MRCGSAVGEGWDWVRGKVGVGGEGGEGGEGGGGYGEEVGWACVKGLDRGGVRGGLGLDGYPDPYPVSEYKSPSSTCSGEQEGTPLEEGLTSQGMWEPPFSGESALSPTR